MPTAKRGKIDYLFQRPGSTNWWIKLRSPGKRIEKSLGTPDRAQAEIVALRDYIPDHKERLLPARPRIEPAWQHKLEPGREHAGPDGSRIVATDKELIHIGHNGAIIRTEPRRPCIPDAGSGKTAWVDRAGLYRSHWHDAAECTVEAGRRCDPTNPSQTRQRHGLSCA